MLALPYSLSLNTFMAGEIETSGSVVDPRSFRIADAIRNILPRGHVIHGYSSADSTIMFMVLATERYSDDEPLLGFGMDGNAERALGRALYTYALREAAGLDVITETQFPESTHAQIVAGSNNSRFDNIVWGSSFWLRQQGDEVIAGSSFGGGAAGMEPIEVTENDPLAAVTALADAYRFLGPGVARLPAISLE
jgi:hypothetical protein